jgi:hypothetical protein
LSRLPIMRLSGAIRFRQMQDITSEVAVSREQATTALQRLWVHWVNGIFHFLGFSGANAS